MFLSLKCMYHYIIVQVLPGHVIGQLFISLKIKLRSFKTILKLVLDNDHFSVTGKRSSKTRQG